MLDEGVEMFGFKRTPREWEDGLYIARAVPPICAEDQRNAELFGVDLDRVATNATLSGNRSELRAAGHLHLGMLWALKGFWGTPMPRGHHPSDTPWALADMYLESAAKTYDAGGALALRDSCLQAAAGARAANRTMVMQLADYSPASLMRMSIELKSCESRPGEYAGFLRQASQDSRIDRAMAGTIMLMSYEQAMADH